MLDIAIIGTGYVGLVSGVCLADSGHRVVCVDMDPDKVDAINRGDPPIHEEGLAELLERWSGDRLTATTDLEAAVRSATLVLICVGTPFDGRRIDLSYIEQACEQVGRAMAATSHYAAVVVRSTVVPGTTDELVLPTLELASGRKAGAEFGVGMNPEFLREGQAIADFMNPGRVVLGGLDDRTRSLMREAYAGIATPAVMETTSKTAEMIKYASNALYANLISFSNEIANICDGLGGLDVVEVMRGVQLDERLTPLLPNGDRLRPDVLGYLAAGCGFGGSCFPKDVRAIIARARAAGVETPVLEAVMRTNQLQPGQVLRLLAKRMPSIEGAEVAVLGVAFKPGTDDIRESPSLPILRRLREQGANVRAYDPVARWTAERELDDPGIRFTDTLQQAVADVDAVLLVTSWPEFARLPDLLASADPAPVVVDGRRMLEPERFPRYEGIGLRSEVGP